MDYLRSLRSAAVLILVFTLIAGIIYPLVMVGIGGTVFGRQAGGSLVYIDGKPVGSELIGQKFTRPKYFHPRPSAVDYDASTSGAANFAPTNREFIDRVKARVEAVRLANPEGSPTAGVPVDMVTSSGSGLDPDITVAAARVQAPRVAQTRNTDVDRVNALIDELAAGRQIGFLGQTRVNVLLLNTELDKRFPVNG